MPEQYQRLGNIESTVGAGVKVGLEINRKMFQDTNDIFPAKVVTLKDPYRSGCIGIKITGIHQDDVKAKDVLFAPMLMPFGGGDNYGFFAMPPVGSDVMVTFLDGDPKNPVILGAWQSRKKVIRATSPTNAIDTGLASASKYRALNTGDLTNNAQKLVDNYVNKAVKGLSSTINGCIGGFSLGSMETLIQGKIGEIPGISDVMPLFNTNIDSVAGSVLTTTINTVANVANINTDSIFPILAAGTSIQSTLNGAISSINSMLGTITAPTMFNIGGCPNLIKSGLATLTGDMTSGALGPVVQTAFNSASTSLQNAVMANVGGYVSKGLSIVTAISSANSALDQVNKCTSLLNKVQSGSIPEADALKGLSNGSIDYILGDDGTGSPGEYVFGPQCPLAYRNQTPGRTLEEVGQNLTETTPSTQEQLDSCYVSQDKYSAVEDANLSPEPLNYIWKSPIGSSIEIDDTGYSESGKGLDNRGVRLTTKKGAIVHLVDEKDSECILIRDKNNNYIWIDTTKNNMHIVVHNDMTETIHNDKTTTTGKTMREVVGGDRIEHVTGDSKEVVKGNKNLNISKNEVSDVGGNYTLTVTGNVLIKTNGNVNIAAAQNVVIGGALKTTVEAGVELKLKAPIINFESM